MTPSSSRLLLFFALPSCFLDVRGSAGEDFYTPLRRSHRGKQHHRRGARLHANLHNVLTHHVVTAPTAAPLSSSSRQAQVHYHRVDRRHGRSKNQAEANLQRRLRQSSRHRTRKTFHNLVNNHHHRDAKAEPGATPALDLMRHLSARDVLDTQHPALHEIVKVAKEVAESHDEDLASATIPVIEESLDKLQALVAQDPGASDFISDMRAQVCAQKKDTEYDKCKTFMDSYCSTKGETAACKAFMGDDEEEEEEETTTPPPPEPETIEQPVPEADEGEADLVVDDQAPGKAPTPLPEQGFEGENVAHIDGETQTDDWRHEFGPGQPDTYDSICAEHPGNEWCRMHGYGSPFHAGAFSAKPFLTSIFASLWLGYYVLL
ncbi:unnamed protein product [Amoebophrya sp. A120]|nr:unnamed protein product [Amoebophrya sp. A120]|eukprot:GSA120T00006438001.1